MVFILFFHLILPGLLQRNTVCQIFEQSLKRRRKQEKEEKRCWFISLLPNVSEIPDAEALFCLKNTGLRWSVDKKYDCPPKSTAELLNQAFIVWSVCSERNTWLYKM